ncbi:uncharacterized protein PHACADRAFT_88060 [Phanerochaete carnosa HHB-10118-sp]|uniref:Uncharacterized protein n=1 Tax=Phanerochaete carnosa (strain HHB-10118-sp) TaxID=650164 RepID=K5WIC1_PHACS|nr:uncharacterized protein PHACADRAFT_88060 [Phanerochaete carnosa HHB-10118-sp]EKM58829.1 hypothetical protein PHACADRAFT_88060 [Phanerochaete carnosa HHB-10118-sp]
MFRLHRQPPAPDEIYSSSLQTFRLGHALWYPEPHGSGEPQIGDVGFIREGAFVRLFNLDTTTPEKKVVYWDPPFQVAEPLPPGVLKTDTRRRPLAPDHYCSHGVQSKTLSASADITAGSDVAATLSAKYTCSASQGAVLVLESEAHAESIFDNRALKKYIIRHHHTWHAYARNDLFRDIKAEDIVMISGWVKTEDDWVVAAFGNTSTSTSGSVEGRAGGVAGLKAEGSHTSSVTGAKMHRHGERYLDNASGLRPADAKRDQSVFVKRLKVRRRLLVLWKVVAGAGYDLLPYLGDARGGPGEEGTMVRGLEHPDEMDTIELYDELCIPLGRITERIS